MDEDYTLLSSKEIGELKQDMDYLKKNPLGGTKSGKSLQESIDKLNENMEMLIEIFKEASDMMKAEERESDIIVKRITPLEQKLDELSDQNQKIARGILAVADMVSAQEQKPMPRPQMQQRPVQMQPRPMPAPMSNMPQQMPSMQVPRAAPPMMPPQPAMGQGMPMPPLPPKKEEKKGMFSFK